MITFHVIYTPGTVVGFSRFAPTLLQEPNCRLRLVSNGCSSAEVSHLQTLCTAHDRLDFMRLPTETLWHHPVALDHLQSACDEPYFAIIDSDIFAMGAFLPDEFSAALTYMLPFAAFWDETEEAFQEQRQRMGCTYVAIYDNAAVTRVREKSSLGFGKTRWELLTEEQQQTLESVNFIKRFYDTGKVINAYLLAEGGELEQADAPSLRHLGGISRAQFSRQGTLVKYVRRMIKYRVIQSPRAMLTRMRRRERKVNSGNYFSELLRALESDGELPTVPKMHSPYVEEKMGRMSAEIATLYEKEQ